MAIISRLLTSTVVLVTLASYCGKADAQSYPERPIKLILPLSAGSPTDVTARQLSPVLEQLLKQPVVIENRVGGGSSIAASAIKQSPPDGYTLLFATSQIAAAPALTANLSFNPETDFTPIIRLAISPTFLAVNANLPIKSVADLISYAKSRPDELTFASTGPGTSSHLQGAMLNALAGIKTRHIPYRMAGQAVGDVATGEVSFIWFVYQAFDPFVQTGKMRVIAVNADERLAALPDTPTMKESGFPTFAPSGTWFAVFGPTGMAPAVVKTLHDAFLAAMQDEHVSKAFKQQYTLPFLADSKALGPFLSSEVARYKEIAKTAGISPQ